MTALEERAAELSALTRFDDEAETISPADADVAIRARDGKSLSARLVIGADGRQSLCREAAVSRSGAANSIRQRLPQYQPFATASKYLHGVSYAARPCVFVPLPGDRCSVVWVAAPKEAERLIALTDEELFGGRRKAITFILGRVNVEPGRHLFPLAIEQPRQFALHRIVLVGEAAHVLPPIGAQGLNMGLRDAADIADIVRRRCCRARIPARHRC